MPQHSASFRFWNFSELRYPGQWHSTFEGRCVVTTRKTASIKSHMQFKCGQREGVSNKRTRDLIWMTMRERKTRWVSQQLCLWPKAGLISAFQSVLSGPLEDSRGISAPFFRGSSFGELSEFLLLDEYLPKKAHRGLYSLPQLVPDDLSGGDVEVLEVMTQLRLCHLLCS